LPISRDCRIFYEGTTGHHPNWGINFIFHMLQQIIKAFYRNIFRSGFQYATIITGLSIGMAVSLLIYVYVRGETRYETHFRDVARLYRVHNILTMEGKTDRTAKNCLNAGEALQMFYPEIESYMQFLNISKQTIRIGDKLYANDKVVYADSNAFTFFSYPLLFGDAATALTGPNKVVISKSIAEQYFGSADNAFEKTMEINNKDFLVTGIYNDKAGQTHIPYNIFLSLTTLPQDFLAQRNREYMWITTYTYVKLKPTITEAEFQKKLSAFEEKVLVPYVKKAEVNGSITMELEPIRDIHLNNTLRFDYPGAINPDYLRIFSAVGILTLLIALINYTNLTTAKVSNRIKEVGIKKYLGASRTSLFFQFVFETILTAFICFAIALILVFMALPELNNLTGSSYGFTDVVDREMLITAIFFVFLFGFAGSLYPAILLSSFRPLNAMRSYKNVSRNAVLENLLNPAVVRKILVTAQFAISIFLIIGTLVIIQQFRFMNTRDMGFDQEQVMVIDIPNDTTVSNHLDVLRNKLMEIPSVKSVSFTSSIPGSDHGALTMNMSQSGGSEIKVINTYMVDDKFQEALGIELKEGRFFSREFTTDPQQSFVINEAAAKFLGWDEPLQKKVESPFGQKGVVIGVLKDFNYKSLHSTIEPLILMNTPTSQGYLLAKIRTADLQETVDKVSTAWTSFDPSHPYEYFFLDTQFQKQYLKEQRLISIFAYFSAFAIFISCLGLIGLAIFTNATRIKEIGIRKTLGATKFEIITLLSKGFMFPIIIATLIAWSISFYLVRQWLTQFAYRIDLTVVPFLLGSLIALIIAALTIGYFARIAARQDIVTSLRYE
jgi:putative ABC transport system permease protein